MNISRVALALASIGIAGGFHVDALGYPSRAASMPLIYSVVVALLGVAMLVQEVIGARRRRIASTPSSDTPGTASAESDSDAGGQRWKALLVLVLAAIYVNSIMWLGYVLATVVFMLIALAIVRHVALRFSLIGISVLVAMVCLVFIGFLGLPVPILPPVLAAF
ncbi:tripartite tricarboxylate transporter TctB family protein [Halomonas binhaiensis]|uniref:Tripartite tricarboxylate transporter TctB family protein n=1 Tax=Halomonas binhaiensis TaxID=2562282 RepID=A0A5C1NF31_9GAMM|nr:tripartite tricarboxylate transporter TctB family protein [Halomonas binhaiensis]QEM81233.1 tripartite tricarboxylate transporter TctB family protein [Halomonas binhaiensis]